MTAAPTAGLIGIAVAKGAGRNWILTLTLAPGDVPLGTLSPDNIRLTTAEGAAVTDLVVTSVTPSPGRILVDLDDRRPIPLDLGDSDLPAIILSLVGIAVIDPAQSYAGFLLGTPPAVSTAPPAAPIGRRQPQLGPAVALDYLARDYPAFRQVMLEQLSMIVPGFGAGDGPADLPVALVETLAYAADQVSYFQDAVATEAYLNTARKRSSVRRHARLVDYRLHEGCNARAFVYVAVSAKVTLPAGTVLAAGARRFITMRAQSLDPALNKLTFAAPPNDPDVQLPQGATRATLAAGGTPQPGDVLVMEEVINPATGTSADNDPGHRHVVRLTSVRRTAAGTEIAWDEEDALPFPLVLTATIKGDVTGSISVARGNMVLADDGAWQAAVPLAGSAPFDGAYQPALPAGHLTYAAPLDAGASASAVLRQDPRRSLPQLLLTDGAGFPWTARIDLMRSGSFARDCVVEAEPDANRLRFGDGVYGRRPAPGTGFTVGMRLGNGPGGNVGADTIDTIDGPPISGVVQVRNPLPAVGGTDPEPVMDARLYAPTAFRAQQRAVTPDDYAARATQFPGVAEAAAEVNWTGSWYTMSVAVRRPGAAPVEPGFVARLTVYLDCYRSAGVDVAVVAARFVGIVVRLTVHCRAGASVNAVRSALRESFATGYGPDGRPAFFHPDNFRFGQPVRLSEVLERAMAVPGVGWIVSDPRSDPRVRFGRVDVVAPPLSAPQIIEIAPLEVASAAPEHGGEVTFYVVEP